MPEPLESDRQSWRFDPIEIDGLIHPAGSRLTRGGYTLTVWHCPPYDPPYPIDEWHWSAERAAEVVESAKGTAFGPARAIEKVEQAAITLRMAAVDPDDGGIDGFLAAIRQANLPLEASDAAAMRDILARRVAASAVEED